MDPARATSMGAPEGAGEEAMRLEELAELLERHIIVKRVLQSMKVVDKAKPWHCCIDKAETKDSKEAAGISSSFGVGATPDEAIIDYVHRLRGKILVLDFFDKEKRREFSVPLSLEP